MRSPHSGCSKRVLNSQTFDLLAVLQVLAVKPRAARGESGGDDQGVVEAVTVACLEIDTALIQSLAGHNAPQWHHQPIKEVAGVLGRYRRLESARDNAKGLLDNLKADDACAGFRCRLDEVPGDAAFMRISAVEK